MPSDPGTDAAAPGPAPGPTRRGLTKRGRLGIIVAVAVVGMVVAFVLQRQRIDDYEHAFTRAQVAAPAAGDAIDLATFPAAWAADPAGATTNGLVPAIAGTRVVHVEATANPPQVVVDYQIDQGGQSACVRVTRTSAGTEVTDAEVPCVDFTFSPTL